MFGMFKGLMKKTMLSFRTQKVAAPHMLEWLEENRLSTWQMVAFQGELDFELFLVVIYFVEN